MQTLTEITATDAEFPMTLSLGDFAAMTAEWQLQALARPDDVRLALIADALDSVLKRRTQMQAKLLARQDAATPWSALRQVIVASLGRGRLRLAGQVQHTAARPLLS